MPATFRYSILIMLGSLLFGVALGGCATQNVQGADGHSYPLAPLSQLPEEVQSAPVSVQQAYQFAVANPGILEQIPCYCGCGGMGHTSNYACYVYSRGSDGEITYDSHALGCSICVDITLDTMRMMDQGKTLPEIRTYVDGKYARYGPSNIP